MSGPASAWAEEDLARLERAGLRRILEPLQSPQGPFVRIDGEWLVNFSSNDYLGLCGDPRLAAAAATALETHGTGTGASRLVVGDTPLHQCALEERIARFVGTPTSTLFNSGYAANIGILQALLSHEDAVFSDELNHASIIDGCRLSRAKVLVYPHRDMSALDLLPIARVHAREAQARLHRICLLDGWRIGAPAPTELVALCTK